MAETDVITFVAPCKGRLEHLGRCLPSLCAQPDSAVVVVDSNCPDGAGAWTEANFPQARVVRLDDGGKFNLSACRNAGLAVCESDWVCFIDADVILAPGFTAEVAPRLAPGSFYLFANFAGRSDLTGTCVVRREDANRIGGYDEVFEAWGGRDRDFYTRLGLSAVRAVTLPNSVIAEIIAHDDDLRTTFYERKDMALSQSISALYRLAKFNLISHGGAQALTLKDRRYLYAQSEQAVRRAAAARDRRAQMVLNLPVAPQFVPASGGVRQSLTIEIDTSRLRT